MEVSRRSRHEPLRLDEGGRVERHVGHGGGGIESRRRDRRYIFHRRHTTAAVVVVPLMVMVTMMVVVVMVVIVEQRRGGRQRRRRFRVARTIAGIRIRVAGTLQINEHRLVLNRTA